ncbi:MAG TPA: hypothetical protein PLV51_05805 [Lentimicrobium sp.]|jgi:hypothetical protein|nr:hypothetical protein [Lentimicrobium sp.]
MKPWKIALFILLVMGGLLLATLFSRPVSLPGMRSEDGLTGGKIRIKYPTLRTFLGSGAPVVNTRVDSVITLAGKPDGEPRTSLPDFTAIDTAGLERIVYPSGDHEFPLRLRTLFEGESCRILHYGDSQLEGDRISGYLRHRLQSVFGGSGPGFIPVKQAYEQISAHVTVSDNWERLAAFDPTQEPVSDKNYGVYASFSRFTKNAPHWSDSAQRGSPVKQSAYIRIMPSFSSYPALRRFNTIGLHYGNANFPVKAVVRLGDSIVNETALIADGAYHCLEIRTDGTPGELTFVLEGRSSPDFYGLTLDGGKGISLDNIAMRGASGTVFSRLNPSGFKAMAVRLNPQVLIFQYGGNTVPYMNDSVAIDDYTRYLAGNIRWVNRMIPDAMVLFIGPGDMSTMVNGNMVTYPLLPYLDARLRETCNRNGWAYWSMFRAMGGLNAMPAWVDQGLASTDYTHFSPKGSRTIAELFFTSLYLDLMR